MTTKQTERKLIRMKERIIKARADLKALEAERDQLIADSRGTLPMTEIARLAGIRRETAYIRERMAKARRLDALEQMEEVA